MDEVYPHHQAPPEDAQAHTPQYQPHHHPQSAYQPPQLFHCPVQQLPPALPQALHHHQLHQDAQGHQLAAPQCQPHHHPQ